MRKLIIAVAVFLTCAASASAALPPLSATDHMTIHHPSSLTATLSASPTSKLIHVEYAVNCYGHVTTVGFNTRSGLTHKLNLSKAARHAATCSVTLTGSIAGYGSIHESLSALGRLTGR
jgi:hypothetical protein